MSQNLRVYRNLNDFKDGDDLIVTSMAGPRGRGFQFTVGMKFCILTEEQAADMIRVLMAEFNGIHSISECSVVLSDGSLVPENNASEVKPKD
jgi:hypothetical protein